MSVPDCTAIADAMVQVINDASLSMEVEAKRSYLPRFTLPEMVDLRVMVVPHGSHATITSREAAVRDYEVDVAVQRRLKAEGIEATEAELDELLMLPAEIEALLLRARLPGIEKAICIGVDVVALYDTAHLEQLRQLTSLSRYTYRVVE